jgi:hypothetical protein
VTVARDFLGDVRGAATNAASGLRDSAVSQGQGLLDQGREQAQQTAGQLVDSGAQYAHGIVDQGASAVRDAVGAPAGASSPEDQKAKADEMYDEMLTRLRRDLISELEAGGHLLRYD